MVNSQVLNTNPVLYAHGDFLSTSGGIHLSNNESWIDAGDYQGECHSVRLVECMLKVLVLLDFCPMNSMKLIVAF